MANIFQNEITPLKPNVLSEERVYVYVPEATSTRKGIAAFNSDEFLINNGIVRLDKTKLSANPFETPSLVKLSPTDFVLEDGIVTFNMTSEGVIGGITEDVTALTSRVNDLELEMPLKVNITEGDFHIEYLKEGQSTTGLKLYGQDDITATVSSIMLTTEVIELEANQSVRVLADSFVYNSKNVATEDYVDSEISTLRNNLSGRITALDTSKQNIIDYSLETQASTIAGAINEVLQLTTTNTNNITTITGYFMSGTNSTDNPAANVQFVNSSIATNTANFIGTFANVQALLDYTGTITNNDYANVTNSERDFLSATDMNNYDKTKLTNYDYGWVPNGTKFDLYRFNISTQTWENRATDINKSEVLLITAYNRYKYNGQSLQWIWEYTVNTSGFTAAQWAAINSGATSTLINQIGTNQTDIATLNLTVYGAGGVGGLVDTVNTNTLNITDLQNNKMAKSTLKEYTLFQVDWANYKQTIAVEGLSLNKSVRISNGGTGTDAEKLFNSEAIAAANIYDIVNNGSSLTFTCQSIPETDLSIIIEVYDAIILPNT